MKKFLILSLIFLVGSCKLNELINNEKPIIIDSLVIHHDTIPYYKENENNYDMMENNREYEKRYVSDPKLNYTRYNIINYTDTTKILDNGFGTIAYNAETNAHSAATLLKNLL